MDQILDKKIQNAYNALIFQCTKNLPEGDLPLVENAFDFAAKAIGNSTWENGEFILSHSISVAKIAVLELGLSTDALISSLLHNVYEHKGVVFTAEEVKKQFGANVADILDGIIKINSLNTENLAFQSENFRRLMLALSGDVKVILIKIADQMQDMRTMDKLPVEVQNRYSIDTWHLYAPLAHRLGLYKVNSELLDLALKYLHPEDYMAIVEKLKETSVERASFVSAFVTPIEQKLHSRGFDFEMKARTKSIYSIWNKMQKQKVDFHEVYDLFAIRIILNSEPENEKATCWQVFSMVTEEYLSNPDRLRDWITYPKSNGYESLHTTVLGPGKRWVEVQIRTHRMDDIAENGLAAHWRYKGGKGGAEIDKWLKNVREILENPQLNPVDFIEDFKVNIYEDEIFVFTPKGDLIKLRAGATILDFAYEIHSRIGDRCVGGKVNNKLVTLKYQLKNGDQISVETSNNQRPKMDWLDFVVTSKAKTRIKASLNEEHKREAENGKEILRRKFKNWKIDFNDIVIRDLLKHYKLKLAADLYYNISVGKIDTLEIKEQIIGKNEESQQEKITELIPDQEVKELSFDNSDDYLVIDNNLKDVNYKLAVCCNPIFGDEIFGFVTILEGIKIHRVTCPNAKQLFERYPYRIIKAKWRLTGKRNSFQASIHISGSDRLGIVTDISRIISKEVGIQMRSIAINSENKSFDGNLRVFVNDLDHLDFLMQKLKNIKGVHSVTRADA
ncbi:MAG: bifunctional (p)ppGpp synthetase/guanosine-3',5'-bis(diphosphate) 3'-pyrophosphohydrolase [Mariniphaga sp.]|nr:bifunctional (p)ppGpp synthetase/guanosine-3',5'-bis(diphosphate) 3'-pyrophosphohydrolase [Mariniphaga sp.]